MSGAASRLKPEMLRDPVQIPFRQLELTQQLEWLVKLRWVALCALTVAVSLAWIAGAVAGMVPALWSVTLWLAVSNVLYQRQLQRLGQSEEAAVQFGCLQIGMDLVVLAVLVHLTGGIENPLLFYLGFHSAVAAVLFGLKRALAFAIVAVGLGTLVGVAELTGALPHHHLGLGECWGVYGRTQAVAFVLFALATVCLGTCCLVSTVSRRARELKRQAGHYEQMVSLGALAAGIAHEIGNPLAAISSVAQIIRRKATDPKLGGRADLVLEHVARIRKIVDDMVQFAHSPEEDHRLVDVNVVVQQALDLIQYDPRCKNVEVLAQFDEHPLLVRLPPKQLVQVCMNLLFNAMDAMPQGGRLGVSTGREESEVTVTIEDSGTGIPEDIRARIFEPFFTTKPVGRGTGLGLSVSFGILRSFGGSIMFDSQPGLGTRFCIHLPYAGGPGEGDGSHSGG